MVTFPHAARRHALAWAWLIAAGCTTVRLVSDYDETTDRDVSALQKLVDDSLTALARQSAPACLFAAHRQFYTAVHSALNALAMRNRARGAGNAATTDQIAVLDTVEFAALEHLHRLAGARTPAVCMDSVGLALDRQAIDQSFEAILRLELAKKRGG
ncbi:MAG TPA: hypothetical protein VNF92_09445 [Gemmatimonadaceae bacterium]|nr:hypothetical protein [Gemmatimonadaceae bacterium]